MQAYPNPLRFLDAAARLPKLLLIAASLASVVLVGLFDYWTGPELSFSIFYLAPIMFVAWLLGGGWGTLVSVLSALTWLIADLTSGDVYSHPIIPIWNACVRLAFFLIVTIAFSTLRRALEHEQAMARSDNLTGVFNGRAFAELAEREIARMRRYPSPTTIAYFDVNHFKMVNDGWGHMAGDALIFSIAQAMQHQTRSTDVVARLGGDEFVILMPETDVESSQVVLKRVHQELLVIIRQRGFPVSFSIGVVTFFTPPSSVDAMIGAADQLMYSAKRSDQNDPRFAIVGAASPQPAASRETRHP